MSDPRCAKCGKPESEHHKFTAPKPLPPGCVCRPEDWFGDPLGICGSYSHGALSGHCKNC